jgi:hypothetical protein
MSSTAKEIGDHRAVDQAQQSEEFAAVACGGLELEGKSASIKSISECIQLSNASLSRAASFSALRARSASRRRDRAAN